MGLSLRDLSTKLKCSAAYLCDVEHGNRRMGYGRLTLLSKLSHRPVEYEYVDCGHCNGSGKYGVAVIGAATERNRAGDSR